MFEDLKKQLEEIMSSKLSELGAELFDLKVAHRNKTIGVEVIIDKPSGGITVDECTSVNRLLTQTVEENQIITGDYTIEVSSPGLDRPLKNKRDFMRVIGKEVQFHLFEKIEGKVEHMGKINEVNDQTVLIETKSNSITIPFEKISKAVQVITIR